MEYYSTVNRFSIQIQTITYHYFQSQNKIIGRQNNYTSNVVIIIFYNLIYYILLYY